MVMFSTQAMRRAFIVSKQPLSREEMDNRVSLNRKERYWKDVADKFSHPDTGVEVFVQNQTVLSCLEEELDVSHRRAVSAGEW